MLILVSPTLLIRFPCPSTHTFQLWDPLPHQVSSPLMFPIIIFLTYQIPALVLAYSCSCLSPSSRYFQHYSPLTHLSPSAFFYPALFPSISHLPLSPNSTHAYTIYFILFISPRWSTNHPSGLSHPYHLYSLLLSFRLRDTMKK